jgi:hypothetical protein
VIKIETTSRWGGVRPGAGGKPKLAWQPPDLWQWFCVRTGYDQELSADSDIRVAGFEVFNPSVWEPASPPRRGPSGMVHPARPAGIRPMFRRYFFVRLNLANPDWQQVRRVEGVDYLISGSASDPEAPGIPIAAPEYAIALLRNLCELNDCEYPDDVDLRDLHADPIDATGGGGRFLRRQRRQEREQQAAVAAQLSNSHGPIVRAKPLAIGSGARVMNGPLAREDLTGICEWSDGDRLLLLMDIMGGARVTVSRRAVEAV